MDKQDRHSYFPIRIVTERTGVGASTLRAWERRYGLLHPKRTPKGHRLYSEADILLIKRVLELLDEGHSISEAARRVLAAGEQGEATAETLTQANEQARIIELASGQWSHYLERMLTAIEEFSPKRLDAIYNEASSLYPLDLVSKHLIEPILKLLGERWKWRPTGIAEEHFFSAWLRNKLGARLHHAMSQATGSKLVVACVPGHRHEVGVLLFVLAALGRGYQVVYLGADTPLDSLPLVVERCGARGVVLAGGRTPASSEQLEELHQLVQRIAGPVFVGGPLSAEYERAVARAGATPIGAEFALALHLVSMKVPVQPTVADSESQRVGR